MFKQSHAGHLLGHVAISEFEILLKVSPSSRANYSMAEELAFHIFSRATLKNSAQHYLVFVYSVKKNIND